MKRNYRYIWIILLVTAGFFMPACTDLEVEFKDSFSVEQNQ